MIAAPTCSLYYCCNPAHGLNAKTQTSGRKALLSTQVTFKYKSGVHQSSRPVDVMVRFPRKKVRMQYIIHARKRKREKNGKKKKGEGRKTGGNRKKATETQRRNKTNSKTATWYVVL